MAAPPINSRVAPSETGAYKVPDGFQCVIALASAPGVWFWEIDPKPPAIDGGEPIDTTTMLNTAWRTMSPQSLKKLDNLVVKCAYDPDVWNTFVNTSINDRFDSVTVTYPTADKLAMWAYCQKWDPDAFEIGKMPTGTLTIVITNFDVVNQIEAGPVYQSAGT